MKVVKLEAEAFKRLRAVSITPKGNIVPISGRNAQGKSSCLDALYAALGGGSAIPGEPIRKGSTKAKIKLDLGEIVVTRTFTKSGTSLTVEDAEGGAYKSPQKMLDALFGAIAMDPLAFTRLKPRDQFDELRKLAHVDLDFEKLDALNRADYDRRTDINRDAKALRAQAEGVPIPELPQAGIDPAGVQESLRATREELAQAESANHNREDLNRVLAEKHAKFQRDRQALMDLKAEIQAHEETLASLPELQATESMVIRIQELEDSLAQAGRLSAQVEQHKAAVQRKADLTAQAEAKEQEAAKLTAAMEARTQTKQEAIAKADMPIPGLGFGEGVVLYNGVPFDQASSAEQLKVSTSIAMAVNPKLRVIRITDGSLLDEDSLAMLHQMAEEHDFQVFLEIVDSTGKVGVYIEDGEVKADNQTDAPEPFESVKIHAGSRPMDAIQPTETPDEDGDLPWEPGVNLDEKLDRRHATGADLDIP